VKHSDIKFSGASVGQANHSAPLLNTIFSRVAQDDSICFGGARVMMTPKAPFPSSASVLSNKIMETCPEEGDTIERARVNTGTSKPSSV